MFAIQKGIHLPENLRLIYELFSSFQSTSPFCSGLERLPKGFQYTDYPPKDDFEFFSALEPYYHIFERIFSFLDHRDLRKCCLVNKSWKDLAEITLAKRSYVTWFTYYKGRLKPRLMCLKRSEKFWHSNVGCVVILFDSRRVPLKDVYLVWTQLKAELPLAVNIFALNCSSVVSQFDSDVKGLSEYGLPSLIDGFFIPKIPNIKTIMIKCDMTTEDIEYINIEPDEEVKCLLIFTTKKLEPYLSDLLDRLLLKNGASSVAIGGGIVRGTSPIEESSSHRFKTSINTFCIAFLKNKNLDHVDFDAYSVLIQNKRKAETEQKLLQFKSQITMRKEAFGVRVCCRGKANQEEELKVFIRLFPDIPILGFTTLGEIGWDCFGSRGNEDGETERKRRRHLYAYMLHHEWSTVFMLITWGAKRNV